MIFTTNQYNLVVGSQGRVARILKEFLYQIPEVRGAVPQVNSRENHPTINDKYDATAQAAVTFFQNWQNLKLRDGRVNHETWMALGKFAPERKVELQTLHDPILKLLLANPAASVSNKNLMMWPSQYGYYTHQNSVKRVLKNALSAKDMKRLLFAIQYADRPEWQTVEFSYRHAMTPAGTSQADARKRANQFVDDEIRIAQNFMEQNNSHEGMLHLGYAMHCLQDATSPAHAGFQVYEGGNGELAGHVYEELFDPGPGSWLDEATALAYKYFQNQIRCPADYFDGLGNDVYKR